MADVYLSPSSQHFNRGYGGYGTEERRMNLIADVVEYELTRHGLSTDRNDPEMSLTEIVADANAKNPQLYIAIQSQSADSTLRGAEIFYYKPNTNSWRLASDVFDCLTLITPTDDIGLTDGAAVYGGLGFYELRKTKSPAAIAAVGFHDNPKDADFIINNVYSIGCTIAKGILKYVGREHIPEADGIIDQRRSQYDGISF